MEQLLFENFLKILLVEIATVKLSFDLDRPKPNSIDSEAVHTQPDLQ